MQIAIYLFLLPFFANATTNTTIDLRIREVISYETKNDIYRCILGYDEIYPFIIIEQLNKPLTEGDTVKVKKSWSLKDIKNGSKLFPMKEGDAIKSLKWNKTALDFTYYSNNINKKCQILNILESNPKIKCD